MPVIRRRLSAAQQGEIIEHLLIDREAEDPRWHVDWLYDALPPRERRLVVELAAHLGTDRPSGWPAIAPARP